MCEQKYNTEVNCARAMIDVTPNVTTETRFNWIVSRLNSIMNSIRVRVSLNSVLFSNLRPSLSLKGRVTETNIMMTWLVLLMFEEYLRENYYSRCIYSLLTVK